MSIGELRQRLRQHHLAAIDNARAAIAHETARIALIELELARSDAWSEAEVIASAQIAVTANAVAATARATADERQWVASALARYTEEP